VIQLIICISTVICWNHSSVFDLNNNNIISQNYINSQNPHGLMQYSSGILIHVPIDS